MIYTPLTEEAMKLAYAAHHGQTDKAGVPYIFHPVHLAEQMTDELTTCAALLHDIVEDTSCKLSDLAEKFPPEVVEAVGVLTYGDGDYYDYIKSVAKNPIAKAVKLADLDHNMDEERNQSSAISEAQRAKHKEKYSKAKKILLGK